MRIKLIISYDGTNYGGWQLQKNAPSIQGELEKVLERLTGRRIVIQSAGRTDAGVHALAQAAHFDWDGAIPAQKLPFVFNSMLPRDIRVTSAQQVSEDFHARYSAKGKRYVYTIYNSPHSSALLYNRAAHIPGELNIEAMRRAAGYIRGTHDFKAFCAAGSYVKTTVRTVTRLDIDKQNELVRITVEGDGFLYNMVRIIAGTLIRVGLSRLEPEQVERIIEERRRAAAGFTAPPQGLTLEQVFY